MTEFINESNTTASILPIFAYGSLRNEGFERSVGVTASSMGEYVCRGFLVGVGDHYPCADVTDNIDDSAVGQAIVVGCDSDIDLVDSYEGVKEGYYERRIVFASPVDDCTLYVPMWAYTRGNKL